MGGKRGYSWPDVGKVHSVSLPSARVESLTTLTLCGPTLEARNKGPESKEDGKPIFRFETMLFDPGVLAWLGARYKKSAPTAHPESRVKL